MDVKGLLDKINGDNKEDGWAAVQTLIASQPANDEEKKAKAYACAAMAESLFAKDKIGSAIDWWQECVYNDPLNPTYRLAFVARGLLPAAMKAQALNETQRALNLNKKNPEAWRLLGHCQLALNDTEGAIASFEKMAELDPANPISYLDRADLALELGDWDTVEKLTKQSIVIAGEHHGNVLHQIGLLAMRKGDYEQALKVWDETLAAGCDNPEIVTWNQSVALLGLGRYKEGWRKHEARGIQKRDQAMAIQMHRSMGETLWNNEPPPLRLHVHQEQGYGDAICMARYLPLLVDKGYEVTYEVMEQLVDLLQYSMPDVRVIPRAPIFPAMIGVPEFDRHVPCLSLPRLFGTEVKSVPWKGPFLKANPEKVTEYRRALLGKPAIGFCWSAGIRHGQGIWITEYGKRKSIPFADFKILIDAAIDAGFVPVPLQVGPERADGTWLTDLLPKNPTWADTAALIECLDLVVTVDTGLAHVVGGMGKPLWLLMHTEGSWHWMLERPNAPWNEKSPWYPAATKLFRQKKPHEWGGVIDRVSTEIKRQYARIHDIRRVG